MRKILFAIATLLVVSITGMQASAQDLDSGSGGSPQTSVDAAASGKIFRLAGTLTGAVVVSAGTCTQGFSNQCPTGHVCNCYTAMGAKFTSAATGKGSANFSGTVDLSAAFGPIGNACLPLYGQIVVIAKKDSPTFNVIGGLCTDPRGTIVSNGVMGLAASTRFTGTGYAGYTSTIKPNGRIALRFSGAEQ